MDLSCGDFYSIQGSCYKVSTENKNYNDAQDACRAERATLVEIGSEEEQNLIVGKPLKIQFKKI